VSASVKEFREKLRLPFNDFKKSMNYKETKSCDVIALYEVCFMEYGWSYDEIMELPIPVFMETIGALKKRKEAEIKAMKSGRKKKRIGTEDGNPV